MATFMLRLDPPVHGWLAAQVRSADDQLRVTVSHLSDAVRDLVDAARRVAAGDGVVRCVWMDEPGEHRWLLTRRGGLLDIVVLSTDRSPASDESCTLAFAATVQRVQFIRSVVRAVDAIDHSIARVDYREHWGHRFPSAEVEQLRAQLVSMHRP